MKVFRITVLLFNILLLFCGCVTTREITHKTSEKTSENSIAESGKLKDKITSPLSGDKESPLKACEKIIAEAEILGQKTLSSETFSSGQSDKTYNEFVTQLIEADGRLTDFINKNPRNVAALLLQVRLDFVKSSVMSLSFQDEKWKTSNMPGKDRDPYKTIDHILELDPNNADACYCKARLYGRSETTVDQEGQLNIREPDFNKAIPFARRAVEGAPENVAYREALAIYLFESGNKTESLEVLKQIKNTKNPIVCLISDQCRVPLPEGVVNYPSFKSTYCEMRESSGMDFPWQRVCCYVIAQPASTVETFYRQQWNDIKLVKNEVDYPILTGGFEVLLDWHGDELRPIEQEPTAVNENEVGLLIMVMELKVISEEEMMKEENPTLYKKYWKELPINVGVGSAYCTIMVINQRKLDYLKP